MHKIGSSSLRIRPHPCIRTYICSISYLYPLTANHTSEKSPRAKPQLWIFPLRPLVNAVVPHGLFLTLRPLVNDVTHCLFPQPLGFLGSVAPHSQFLTKVSPTHNCMLYTLILFLEGPENSISRPLQKALIIESPPEQGKANHNCIVCSIY